MSSRLWLWLLLAALGGAFLLNLNGWGVLESSEARFRSLAQHSSDIVAVLPPSALASTLCRPVMRAPGLDETHSKSRPGSTDVTCHTTQMSTHVPRNHASRFTNSPSRATRSMKIAKVKSPVKNPSTARRRSEYASNQRRNDAL